MVEDPPRIAVKIKAARVSLREEITGLLATDKHGVPISRIVSMEDAAFRKVKKLRTAVVTKVKAGGEFKSRVCLRGDLQSLINASFCSAPTTSRNFLKISMLLFVDHPQFIMTMADISRAFAQADYLHPKDRIAVILPEFFRFVVRRGTAAFI